MTIKKGIAVILMIIFHIFYLIRLLNISDYNVYGGILQLIAQLSHNTFILFVGINLVVSFLKYKKKYYKSGENKTQFFINYFKKQSKRSIILLALGFVMSILSYFTFPDKWIKFGILHFVGVSIFLSTFIVDKKYVSLIIAVILLLITMIVKSEYMFGKIFNMCLNTPLSCFITGLANVKYSTLDHFNLLGYFPIICLGIFAGHNLYSANKRLFTNKNSNLDNTLNNLNKNKFTKYITMMGRNSLKIYFIHFIAIYIILYGYKINFMT